jgi:hypothetical protein
MIFLLIPQVKMPKRLDVTRAGRALVGAVATLVDLGPYRARSVAAKPATKEGNVRFLRLALAEIGENQNFVGSAAL